MKFTPKCAFPLQPTRSPLTSPPAGPDPSQTLQPLATSNLPLNHTSVPNLPLNHTTVAMENALRDVPLDDANQSPSNSITQGFGEIWKLNIFEIIWILNDLGILIFKPFFSFKATYAIVCISYSPVWVIYVWNRRTNKHSMLNSNSYSFTCSLIN